MGLTREGVLAALQGVMDPELGADVASLGMVAGVEAGGAAAKVTLAVPGARPDDRLTAAVEAALRAAGAESVEVAYAEAVSLPAQEALRGVRSIVAAGRGKGGGGKATVAAHLAAALARERRGGRRLHADL